MRDRDVSCDLERTHPIWAPKGLKTAPHSLILPVSSTTLPRVRRELDLDNFSGILRRPDADPITENIGYFETEAKGHATPESRCSTVDKGHITKNLCNEHSTTWVFQLAKASITDYEPTRFAPCAVEHTPCRSANNRSLDRSQSASLSGPKHSTMKLISRLSRYRVTGTRR